MKTLEVQDIQSTSFYLPRAIHHKALDINAFILPAVQDRYGRWLSPLAIDMDTWVAFLGWYFAEGSLNWQHAVDPQKGDQQLNYKALLRRVTEAVSKEMQALEEASP